MRAVSTPPDSSPDTHQTSPERLHKDEVRASTTRAVVAWGFGAAFFNLTSGAIYTSFARSIGADNRVFGLLAGAVPLMGFLQIFTARLVERTGRPKPQMIWASVVGRSLWIVAALLPLISRRHPAWLPSSAVVPLVVACVLASGAFQAFNTPAFFTWMKGLVPDRVRPNFFARRTQVGTSVSLLLTLGGGWIADHYARLEVYCALLIVAGVLGILDAVLFFAVSEPVLETDDTPNPKRERVGLSESSSRSHFGFLQSLKDPSVRNFLVFVALLNFSFGAINPFLWLHTLEHFGWSKTVTGLILNVMPLAAIIATARFWGSIIKKHGTRPVMRFGSTMLTIVPVGWFFARADNYFSLGAMLLLSGIFFCALDQCSQNFITGFSSRGEDQSVSPATMTALYSITAGTSFAVAAYGGGEIAQRLNGIDLEWWGMHFINYHALFAISFGARVLNAFVVSPRLRELDSTSTLDMVREELPELVSALASRLSRPFGARFE